MRTDGEGELDPRPAATLARRYDDALADLSWLATPKAPQGDIHGYQAWVYRCCVTSVASSPDPGAERAPQRLMLRMKRRGISTSQGTAAPVTTGYYSRNYGLRRISSCVSQLSG